MTSCGGLCGPLSDERRVPDVIGWAESVRLDRKNDRIGFSSETHFGKFFQSSRKSNCADF
jgi:hypothetical protein